MNNEFWRLESKNDLSQLQRGCTSNICIMIYNSSRITFIKKGVIATLGAVLKGCSIWKAENH